MIGIQRAGMVWRASAAAMLAFAVACTPTTTPPSTTPEPPTTGAADRPANRAWGVVTREHIDLWFHGFAMLQEDTTVVPYFRRGYRAALTTVRARDNVVSVLDANHDRLAARFTANRSLVNAQFVAMYFGNWNDLKQTVDLFLDAKGDPRQANSREVANALGILAGYFPTAADRDWLRLFMQALTDESTKFYHSYWTHEQGQRAGTVATVDSIWINIYRAKFQRLLTNTRQTGGTVLLSLPLNGEGRTLTAGRESSIAVTLPDQPIEAIYVIAHEAVGGIVNSAIADNVTPAERMKGTAERYTSAAAVRGGAMLLERVAPELVDGYMRYYLLSAGHAFTTSTDLKQLFTKLFELPDAIRDGMARQLDLVLGGI